MLNNMLVDRFTVFLYRFVQNKCTCLSATNILLVFGIIKFLRNILLLFLQNFGNSLQLKKL